MTVGAYDGVHLVHSATKYLGGHSDVVGGFVAVDDDDLVVGPGFTQEVDPGIVRLSAGIESAAGLVADLRRALGAVS